MDIPLFLLLCVALTAIAAAFALQLEKAFVRFRIRKRYTAALEAPSVSVCIPARNETHAMTRCLENVLASTYEKMEIIVFDDNSADDTSVLIKSFAHAGVRFVPGKELPEDWLGKNHALDILAGEASGTYILFLDVDTLVKPTTISEVVGYAITEKLDMVSILPRRNDTWRASVLFAPLRFFWQVIFSRTSEPATSSGLWLVSRDVLQKELGGLETFKTDVQVEASIASRLTTGRAHTLLSNDELGVSTEKKWSSQAETERRLLYPMTGGKWWQVTLAFLGLVLLNIPFFVVVSSLYFGWAEFQVSALWFMCVFMGLYGLYTARMWRSRWWLGALLWPVIIFQELVLFMYSVYGYRTHSITWKGRPVATYDR